MLDQSRDAANNNHGAVDTVDINPQKILKQVLQSMGANALHQFCGNSPSDRVLKSMRNGAVVGLVRGAAVGFVGSEATLGEFTFGLSGLGGAAFGGTVGGIAGAGGGVFKGAALAAACQEAGAYN